MQGSRPINTAIDVTIPIETMSPNRRANHWGVRARLNRECRWAVAHALDKFDCRNYPLPVKVTITRQGPKLLDSDNSISALKSVRDGVASFLEEADNSPKIHWVYRQAITEETRMERRHEGNVTRIKRVPAYAVRIQIAPSTLVRA